MSVILQASCCTFNGSLTAFIFKTEYCTEATKLTQSSRNQLYFSVASKTIVFQIKMFSLIQISYKTFTIIPIYLNLIYFIIPLTVHYSFPNLLYFNYISKSIYFNFHRNSSFLLIYNSFEIILITRTKR